MQAWYLSHSGFIVESEQHILVFDYYLDTPAAGGLSEGVFRPEAFADRPITVFSSHGHHDHFNPCVLKWQQQHTNIRYLFSSDIREQGERIQSIAPGESVQVRSDLTVRALCSTDEGVAFLVETPAGVLYHAGDLNWWHWNGETDSYNHQMKTAYCDQIDLLRAVSIDLAFVPADPRLEDKYAWGLDYFMRTVGARRCVPMHLWDHYETCQRLLDDPCTQPYRVAISTYHARGEQVL